MTGSGRHRDARQFATALSRHLYVMRDSVAVRDSAADAEDFRRLEETKDNFRDRWSEALMIGPDTVISPDHEVNEALTRVYGLVKRLKRLKQGIPGRVKPHDQGPRRIIDPMREAMRRDLGLCEEERPRAGSA
ncbi:hypothetical protein [Streptomyces sp. RPT161]|uniref:hypothetical protein n=1 Tax=Streptomyces sp. RPT161 TaxID=3015993 RepID=UPI0022B8E683|nr:hypothetical protein [Streptomyces sp. RPT161]